MLLFGKGLVKARELVLADLGREGMPLERACAAAVRLLDLGYFRIGNDVYADENGSFGLTTLERRHVKRHQDRLVFAFSGKSGVDHRIEIDDADRDRGGRDHAASAQQGRPAAAGLPGRPVVALGHPRPGQRPTCARPPASRRRPRTSAPGTPPCSPPRRWPRRTEPGETKASRKRAVAGAMKEVSEFLGNTPTLARSSYVDPRVIEAYERGITIASTTRRRHDTPDLRQAALERATLRLIKEVDPR